MRGRHVPVATLFLSCNGFYVYENNFEKILLFYIFSPLLAIKVLWNIVKKMNHWPIKWDFANPNFQGHLTDVAVTLVLSLLSFFFWFYLDDIVKVAVVLQDALYSHIYLRGRLIKLTADASVIFASCSRLKSTVIYGAYWHHHQQNILVH